MSKNQKSVNGAIDGCIEQIKREYTKKNTDANILEGIRSMCDNFRYYAQVQADREFIEEMVFYHKEQAYDKIFEYRPKTVLTSDKALSRKYRGGLIAVMRLNGAIN